MRLCPAVTTILFLVLVGCASQQAATNDVVPQPAPDTGDTTEAQKSVPANVKELTPEVIQTVVRSHFEELQTCYESTLASNNELAGIVELELTISRDGSIEKGRLLKDGIGSAELNLCLVKKMVDWKFPAHTDESVTIEFPFAFSPKR